MIWILILDHESRYGPTKTISPVVKGREHTPGLSVFTACRFVIRLFCYGFRACHRSSTTGRAKKVPDPTACRDVHYDLSLTVGDFIINSSFSLLFFYDPMTFATEPRVVGSVTGSVPVETLH